MLREYNFVGGDVSASDVTLFLGPLSDDDGPFVVIDPSWSLAHVMHAVGAFPSVKQAKNNGWSKPIPPGYEEFTVGKGKTKVFTLTPFD